VFNRPPEYEEDLKINLAHTINAYGIGRELNLSDDMVAEYVIDALKALSRTVPRNPLDLRSVINVS
jgi:hypothetical protein